MTVGIRHDEMRKRNRAMVIAAVRQADRPSRTRIARITGLSHSTISAIASDLIEEGIMREVPAGETAEPRRGRPQIAIAPDPDAARVVCLILSFNSLSAVLVDYCGAPLARYGYRLPTLALSHQELMDATVEAVREVTAGHGPIMRIGIAVQGIADSAGREMLWSPITPHGNVAFAPVLEDFFSVPVTVHNDCNLIAAALRWHRPERYRDNFVAILLSHGIGMGLMLNGHMFTGEHSSGGEFGHMNHRPDGPLCRCGKRGCIEAFAGNYAIWRRAHGKSPMEKPVADVDASEMEALADSARAGHERAGQAFREAAEALGYGLGNLFALIDPAPIAVVGQGTAAFDLLEPEIRRSLAQTAGGQHVDAISFETERNEVPLIEHGCAMTALTSLDSDYFASALHLALPVGAPGREDVA